jgi:serine/threonine protein kinase
MNSDDLLDFADGAVLRGTSYRVSKRLGAGGMGAVYEGEHVKLRRRVCIKMIHPGLRGRDDFLQRMEIEAQTLARLDHPGIVKVFDLGVTDDGIPYFVMEKLEGKDLRRLWRSPTRTERA